MPRAAQTTSPVPRVIRVILHKARQGKEEMFRRALHDLEAAWRKQIPELQLRIFRGATGERGVFIAHVEMPVHCLPVFQEWATEALEREWGRRRTTRFVRDYYGCLEDSTQLAVVFEEPSPAARRRRGR